MICSAVSALVIGAHRSERILLPKRAAVFWKGPVVLGRNRESRSREAAGRRNLPHAVPMKVRGRKEATCGLP
jgi:hypothetical protein